MDTNKKLIAVAVGALLVGGIAGTHLGKNKDEMRGIHRMPDGSAMNSEGMNMADMMSSMNAELAGKTGDAFDQAFLSEMIMHHEGAVGMAESALNNAKHQEIKDLSKAIISAQNTEISQMKQWQSAWFK